MGQVTKIGNAPVTPAMVNGWAPNNENMKAAINDEMRTSATPYCCVVSIRSKEKAMPGRTLNQYISIPRRGETVVTPAYFAKNINVVAGTTR
jgi:hypothetical protein